MRKLLLPVTIWIMSLSVTLTISISPITTVQTHYSVLCVLVCSKLVSIVVYNNKLGFMKNLSQTLEFQENSCRLSTCWHEYSCHGMPCSHQLVSIFIRVENTRLFTNSLPCFPCSVWGKECFLRRIAFFLFILYLNWNNYIVWRSTRNGWFNRTQFTKLHY